MLSLFRVEIIYPSDFPAEEARDAVWHFGRQAQSSPDGVGFKDKSGRWWRLCHQGCGNDDDSQFVFCFEIEEF